MFGLSIDTFTVDLGTFEMSRSCTAIGSISQTVTYMSYVTNNFRIGGHVWALVYHIHILSWPILKVRFVDISIANVL